ncbi:glycoside hydrolase N-terminal domain-containing protein [Paenibacillus sp. NFR01]|uniref:glycoside hydrolase family 95 protein n=1 Tax=Paenibacillus sp. NFR01 TaxID=1566279 RepID=UPI0020C885F9|nr:glycoside hydrolase family 95 protein [Paenibacillus sp. NFR01]
MSSIWFDKPAARWEEALPMGNGRLGGMVFGVPHLERIQLNEDSLWYGGPLERNNPDALAHLEELRRLVFAGRIRDAEELAEKVLTGVPDGQRHYEPLGDLYLLSGNNDNPAEAYRRELDLRDGVIRVNYKSGDGEYEREYFASYPGQVLAVRWTASHSGRLNGKVVFGRGSVLEPGPWSNILRHPVGLHAYIDRIGFNEQGDLIVRGRSGGEEGIRFCCAIRVAADHGRVSCMGGQIAIEAADAATILIAACTDYRVPQEEMETECVRRLDAASAQTYAELRSAHVQDYRALADRMELQLAGADGYGLLDSLPLDRRLARMRGGADDPELAALYFRFGRYLLISCSRPGSLPATLQGIWNKDMQPIWDSKYTININTQMNYWPAESANLAECHEPLLDFIERLKERGSETARSMYGCRGFMAHHNSDIWADTAPQDVCLTSTFWTMGGAWLALHLWDRYDYSRNLGDLQQYYGTMKEAALFLLDFMVEDPQGRLVTCPSSSPENVYQLPNGETGALCYGPSMDSQIIRELFTRCIAAAEILQEDAAFAGSLRQALERVPQPEVGKYGQIQEWSVDYEEVDPGHRHISHLFALHPGSQITKRSTPALAAAAKTTLERRLRHGGGHTGWSRAWILNMWARLEEPELAHDNVMELLRSSTLPNLFCDHPPFQIDGNFGGTAGILEMLLHSHGGELRLLPALPAAWPQGRVRGVRARGGYTVNLEWSNGQLQHAGIQAMEAGSVTVSYGARYWTLYFSEAGETKELDLDVL